MNKNIVLIGFKGCGKTAVGKLLADKLKLFFVDVDRLIEKIHAEKTDKKQSVREIYKSYGELYFRELEHESMVAVVGREDTVLSPGGGAVVDERNRKILKSLGTVVYLDVAKELLMERSMKKDLAAIYDKKNPEESFNTLYNERKDMYAELADITLDITDESKDVIVEQIIERIQS